MNPTKRMTRAWMAMIDLIGRGTEPIEAIGIASIEFKLNPSEMRQLGSAWLRHLERK